MPNTREKLIELLWEAYELVNNELPTTEMVADHLIANGVTVQDNTEISDEFLQKLRNAPITILHEEPTIEVVKEWISVKDRLPALHTDDYEESDGSRVQFEVSDDQWVITASNHQTKARYETGVVFRGWVGEHGEIIYGVTHWMPLPQPPKVENETIFCKDCEHLMFSDLYGECSKCHKGIVKPNDTCKYATKKLQKGE